MRPGQAFVPSVDDEYCVGTSTHTCNHKVITLPPVTESFGSEGGALSVVFGPSVSPEHSLKMHILLIRPILGSGAGDLCFNKPSRGFPSTLEFENPRGCALSMTGRRLGDLFSPLTGWRVLSLRQGERGTKLS